MTFLTHEVMPSTFTMDQRRVLALKNKKFLVIAKALCKKGIDQTIRRCVPKFEQSAVMQEAHEGV